MAGPVTGVATQPVYFDLHLEPGASYAAVLPERHNVFAYVYDGEATIGAAATPVARGEIALTSRGASLPVSAGPNGAPSSSSAGGRSASPSRATARSS